MTPPNPVTIVAAAVVACATVVAIVYLSATGHGDSGASVSLLGFAGTIVTSLLTLRQASHASDTATQLSAKVPDNLPFQLNELYKSVFPDRAAAARPVGSPGPVGTDADPHAPTAAAPPAPGPPVS